MEKKFINYLGGTVHYKTTGEGLPVVLVHGFAEDSSVWDEQVIFLQSNYQLIIPDLPGTGESRNTNGVNSIEGFADCLHEILSALEIEQCIMIGHSMGGYITLAFAEKHPEGLLAYGLFHSSAFADDEAKIQTRKKAIDFITSHGVKPFLETSIPPLFYGGGNSKPIDALLEKGQLFTGTSLIHYYQAMMARPDRTAVLKNSTVPVLFILGLHDNVIPIKNGLEQTHFPAQSYIHILRNSGHMGMIEEVNESNNILANFLEAL